MHYVSSAVPSQQDASLPGSRPQRGQHRIGGTPLPDDVRWSGDHWSIVDDALSAGPRHPRRGRRTLIAWPGYHSGLSLASFDRRVVGAIAKPLAHARADSQMISAALDAGMGVVLPGETWRNQLPPGHKKRAGAFAQLASHRPGMRLDPEARRFSASFADGLAVDNLDEQLRAGATLATTAAHVHEREAGEGRQNDLLLARLTAEEFAARRAFAPAPGRRGRRELYATLIVQGRDAANPRTVEWLASAYARLEGVDGYWIVAVNTTKSAKQLRGYTRLALQLERLSERPTVLSGVGDPHLAFLASGLAATCAGLYGMNFKFPPDELDSDDEDERTRLAVHTYHRDLLGNSGPLGPEGDALRVALFHNRPCGCPHHAPDRPPLGRSAIIRHNSWCIQAEAHAFATPAVPTAEAHLSDRLAQAARNRSFHGLTPLPTGFAAVAVEAARLRGGESEISDG
jgi:hypothetical protein